MAWFLWIGLCYLANVFNHHTLLVDGVRNPSDEHGSTSLLNALIHDLEALKINYMKLEDDGKKSNSKIESLEKLAEKASTQNLMLQAENMKLRGTLEELEQRVEYLEAINRKNVPRTCEDLRALGLTTDGLYLIDPDGAAIGDPPITVRCNLSGISGETSIAHDSLGYTSVEHCEDPGCFSKVVNYEASARQIDALINQSEHCSQQVLYRCFSAPLSANGVNLGWWGGRDGSTNTYWTQSFDPNEHVCECGAGGNNCVSELFPCNCDASAPEWLSDHGILNKKESLPVQNFHFGGLIFDGQSAEFAAGHLVCSGKKEFVSTGSCESLWLAGETNPGYYFVDGPNGINYHLVRCNFHLDPNDPAYQEELLVKLPEFPVSFDFYRSTPYSTPKSVVTYEDFFVNEGNAMTRDGDFTAPLDGIYSFSFHYLESTDKVTTLVNLVLDEVYVGVLVSRATVEARGMNGQSIILKVLKGQKVNAYLREGSLQAGSGHDIRFTGNLLYPL